MTGHGIRRIERLNYVLGGLAIIVAALTVSSRPALGVALGVVLTCLNFAALRWLVFKWTAAVKAGDDKAGANRIYLILPKMMGMMAAVALIVIFLPIDAIGFLIGYSVFLPSIVIGAVLDTVAPGPADEAGPPTGGDVLLPAAPRANPMGEHGTWFDYLNRFSWWQDFNDKAEGALGRGWKFMVFQESHFTLIHVLITLVVLGFVIWGSSAFRKGTEASDGGLVPPRRMNLSNFFEIMAETVYGMVEGALGEKNGRRFFPLIGTLWLFILFGNLIGLVPGFGSPNDTLKTNVALAVMVFFVTHFVGVKEHGLAYFKHFLGPSPALAPLMLPIELVSHIARPVSLSLRLMGNMMADHKVVFSFFTLVPLFIPLPFLALGLLVCVVQAIVFCTLTMVYIGMAVEHEEHGHDEHAHAHAH